MSVPAGAGGEFWAGVWDVDGGALWDAEVPAAFGLAGSDRDGHGVVGCTPNSFDRCHVDRVRDRLRDARGVTEKRRDRPDSYTTWSIHPHSRPSGGWGAASAVPGPRTASATPSPGSRTTAPSTGRREGSWRAGPSTGV